MKTELLAAILAILATSEPVALADETHLRLELDARYAVRLAPHSTVLPALEAMLAHEVTSKWGIAGFAAIGSGEVQAYAGPFYSVLPCLKLGLGAGVENAAFPLRAAAIVLADLHGLGMHLYLEYGGSGFVAHLELNVQVTKLVGTGAYVHSREGAGPRFSVKLPWQPLSVWVAPIYNWERKGFLLVFALRFGKH